MTSQNVSTDKSLPPELSPPVKSKRPNFAHLATGPYSYEALEMVYQDKVPVEKEPYLALLVRDVERIVSGDTLLEPERIVLEGIAALGKIVVLKYLVGFKLAVLLPVFVAAANGDNVDLESELYGAKQLSAMIQCVQRWAASIH